MLGFKKGSGLRSDGGMRSGLEGLDLLAFAGHSIDVIPAETGVEPTVGL